MGGYNIVAPELQIQVRYHNNSFWFHKKLSGGVPRNIRFLNKRSKFTGEHPCRSVISIKLQSNFIESSLRYWYSPVNLMHIFRTLFSKNTSGELLL